MSDAVQLANLIGLKRSSVVLRSLQAFDTEQQFCKMLKYELIDYIDFMFIGYYILIYFSLIRGIYCRHLCSSIYVFVIYSDILVFCVNLYDM